MQQAPIPQNEEERLLSLHTLGLLDTEPEERFDRITRMATKIFNAPISTLTLIDANREWFKSCEGLPGKEGDRAISFCGHALLAPTIFVIPDTLKDPRFADNPMVVGKPFIRFYAGVPIMSADGQRVGVFCIKDTKPRTFSKLDEDILFGLASWAELEVNSRNLSLAISEREKLQEKLTQRYHEAEETGAKEKAILESVGDGLVVVDREGKIVEMSNAAGELLGVVPTECIGRHYDTVLLARNEKGENLSVNDRPLQIAMSTGKKFSTSTTTTYYYVHKDGTQFPVAITVTPVLLGGQIIGAVDIFRDVSKEKEIDQAKTEFVSLAAHQLKIPPTAIKVLTETLLGGKLGDLSQKQNEYLTNIQSSNQRMIDMINALLKVSRLELGAFTIETKEQDVCLTIASIVDELKVLIDKKQLKVETSYPKERKLISIDEPLYRMVIHNLVTNAIKYTDAGGEIRIECNEIEKGKSFGGKSFDENSFVVSVADTGYGIPQEQQSKMFNKFFRADNAREKHTDGTGLGLYIVKSILEHSGGSIWFTSRENEGSTFFVAIPMTGMKTKTGDRQLGDH